MVKKYRKYVVFCTFFRVPCLTRCLRGNYFHLITYIYQTIILNPIEHQGHFVQLEILVSFKAPSGALLISFKAPSGALCCSGCDQYDNYTAKNFVNPRK